MKIIYT